MVPTTHCQSKPPSDLFSNTPFCRSKARYQKEIREMNDEELHDVIAFSPENSEIQVATCRPLEESGFMKSSHVTSLTIYGRIAVHHIAWHFVTWANTIQHIRHITFQYISHHHIGWRKCHQCSKTFALLGRRALCFVRPSSGKPSFSWTSSITCYCLAPCRSTGSWSQIRSMKLSHLLLLLIGANCSGPEPNMSTQPIRKAHFLRTLLQAQASGFAGIMVEFTRSNHYRCSSPTCEAALPKITALASCYLEAFPLGRGP